MLILFLGEENCYRSLLSEALFNHYAPEGFEAMSAGAILSAPTHPRMFALLEQHDISAAGLFEKTWHEVRPAPDVLVTLSSGIDTENCPLGLRAAMHAHWGDDDAARSEGAAQHDDADLEATFALIHARIQAFLAFPHDELRLHDDKLAAALDEVGALKRVPEPVPA